MSRSNRTKPRILGGAGAIVSGLWVAYANFTTVAQLPIDAGGATKILTDPPIYIPWLAVTGFIFLMAWAFWPVEDKPQKEENPQPAQAASLSVSSVNQSGGQIAHTIHNREPDPVPARSLNGDQANAIRKVLVSSEVKGEIMEIQFSSSEHSMFSAQIAGVFEKCGWERQTFCIPHRDKPHGMRAGYKGEKSDAYFLAIEALKAAGFDFAEGEYEGFDADIALDVGILEMTAFQRAADKWPE